MTRIAVAQVALAVGDPEADAAAAERAITAAAGAGADLVVLPELGEQRIRVP
jgi:predicted amidohydrolase